MYDFQHDLPSQTKTHMFKESFDHASKSAASESIMRYDYCNLSSGSVRNILMKISVCSAATLI